MKIRTIILNLLWLLFFIEIVVIIFTNKQAEKTRIQDQYLDWEEEKYWNDILFATYNPYSEKLVLTESDLREYIQGNCNESIDLIMVKLDKFPEVILSMKEYKKQLAKNFTLKYSQHPLKSKLKIKDLTPVLEEGLHPEDGLHDPDLVLDIDGLNSELEKEKLTRIHQGEQDFSKIPEVANELLQSAMKIPNIVHFIWFANRRFEVHHYAAVVGAWRYQKPAAILFHCDREPDSDYWFATKKKCGQVLKVVKRIVQHNIFGNSLKYLEHKSDIARLQILMEVGGIYLDTDSIMLKSVDDFRNYDMVIGQPHRRYAAENAIMFANKNSWFLRRWYYEYRYYKGDQWGYNSLQVPGSIIYYFPDTVHVTFTELCRPHWKEIDLIYKTVFDWKSIYVMHLYQRILSWNDGVATRTIKELAVLNTTYGEVMRHAMWGEKQIRNVTDWILTCDLQKYLED